MLKQRVITAIVLTAIFLLALFGLSPVYFPLFLAAILAVGAWEWAGLSDFGAPVQRIAYLLLVLGVLVDVAWQSGLCCPAATLNFSFIKTLLMIACGWWAVALLLVQAYPTSAVLWGHTAMRLCMGLFVLIPTWLALSYLRFQPQGAWLVLMVAGIVAAADTGGYFTGRKWGKHKLAQAVSPGKTLEGFAGGLLSNIVLALCVAHFTGTGAWVLLAIVIPSSLFSVLGDLLESMVKRHAGIKDSGRILPGHGGILDRMDSITAAAPVFALAVLISGWTLGS
jgi:phosphatidate cytidylyltransferase